MNKEFVIRPIATIKTDFSDKFGIPRQAGIIEELTGEIVFSSEYSDRESLRGIEQFTHLWLIWQFSENADKEWSPTVRPPRLGGNERKGVFATRSPFRPNSLGLSCVRLVSVNDSGRGMPTLTVAGVDMLDNTPIFDIKPYIPYADCIADASGSFASDSGKHLQVEIPNSVLSLIPEDKRNALIKVLSLDPRPQYKKDGEREYGLDFAGINVRFKVNCNVLTVTGINNLTHTL